MLNSYSLMFFSLNPVFASIIILVTFFSPAVGLSGLLSVLLINVFAYVIGFQRDEIQKGLFGFNALFLGLALGYEFAFNLPFILLFITSILVLLLITVWLKGLLAIHNLPFLSFPFILTYWAVSLAASHFYNFQLDEQHIYTINETARHHSSFFYHIVTSLI